MEQRARILWNAAGDPSTCGRIASRSKAPALIRMKLLFATETQKWFVQKATSLSTRPARACATR
jgi:hypothetical protein